LTAAVLAPSIRSQLDWRGRREPVPSIKLATNSLMYRHLEEDMDINCGVILEGTPLPVVGRAIFEEIIAVASGKRTKSELSGVGEEEFAPWIIGPVM
jgi:altronate hydrolase